MQKMLLSGLLCLLLPSLLVAQFEKGQLTLSSGEQLEGYLQKQAEGDLQQVVYFKLSLDIETATAYSPKDADAFRFDSGLEFQAIQVSRVTDNVQVQERSFAKVVARGAIDLYELLLNPIHDEFTFYAQKDGRWHQLSDKPLLLSSGNYTLSNSYIGVLKALTQDCPKDIGRVEQLRFLRKSIISYINAYNSCQDAAYQPLVQDFKVPRQSRYFGGVMAGYASRKTDGTTSQKRATILVLGVAAQLNTYNPAKSRKLVFDYSAEIYKWVELSGGLSLDYPLPSTTFSGSLAAHYLITPEARVKWYTRVGGSTNFNFDFPELPFSLGVHFGFGAYLPAGAKLLFKYEIFPYAFKSIGVALPLGLDWDL